MKRKMFVFPLVVLLLVVLSASTVVAEKGSLPHDGACVAFCARAIIHRYVGPADGDRDDPANWIPHDANGDGKIQICLHESAYMPNNTEKGPMCLKSFSGADPTIPGCPEVVAQNRCVLPEDGWPYWCKLMHAEHIDKHKPPSAAP
jgi:hypothetical protein